MTKKILIVEDNKKFATYLKTELTQAGYDVEIEHRGDRAVFLILNKQPDLVILDIMLPGIDGQQICQTISNDFHGKILMLTALNDIGNEVSSLDFGADDYISKPVDLNLLHARVKALLRRQETTSQVQLLNFGQLEINLSTKIAYYDKQPVELKPMEFSLLALLAINANKVLSRNSIMQSLRGHDYDGIDRTIDLRVSYLRKKLHDNPQKPFRIKTIQGQGYTFVADAWA